jgi:hypothetical protein
MLPFELFAYLSLAALCCEIIVTIFGVQIGVFTRFISSWKDEAL